MDALRVWLQPSPGPRLLITSLDAILQKIPPSAIIENSWFRIAKGDLFDNEAFERFVRTTGYLEDGIVDEPGELAFRDDVIDIFPAGASLPMRIILAEDGTVVELRSYDPVTQRTTATVETMVFGPASEAILSNDDHDTDIEHTGASERHLLRLYSKLQTVFDIFGDADLALADGTDDRLESYLDIIDEARHAHARFGNPDRDGSRSLYLKRDEWDTAVRDIRSVSTDTAVAKELPAFMDSANSRRAFIEFAVAEKQAGHSVVLTGQGPIFDGLCRRLERDTAVKVVTIKSWEDVKNAKPGSFLALACGLERGFATDTFAVVTIVDILGDLVDARNTAAVLAEPELEPGDVVVHEDHGIGILKALESVTVEGIIRDAARLDYRDDASILVPMDEFGKLWRYGSEPDAVTLDRLHTGAWSERRAAIGKDIRAAARHLLRLAKERREARAEIFVPSRAEYASFIRRFPYAETADQSMALDAVLRDLASGTVMNRLVCGDVGFGKTEIALRAAAAVALAGGQVVVIAPTTVLARQHYTTFARRFAGTGIRVEMLSRVIPPREAANIKSRLASGETGIVVATQAILAGDVRLARLALLVVDEEHRFGTREKQAMRALAPLLHVLTMSATPIPRTLQAAMIGIQDVSILATPPSRRRPVRTSLGPVDRASMRVALMREYRRGGQSFVVVPQIGDIDQVQKMLADIVPELSLRVAHGKMKAAVMDDVMVGFADGDGDILLSTNIIESGLDVPRANTIFIWRADRFGLAQLHQLRGRVGRGRAQGIAYLLTPEDGELAEGTRARLNTMVMNDRPGAGLTISMQDLDLRGAGNLTGDDQAGHMKMIGVSLYQKLLAQAVAAIEKREKAPAQTPVLNLGIAGSIPVDYVPEAAVRLNLYARLLRAVAKSEIDEFAEELEDRFGELPDEVLILMRLAGLRTDAMRLGIARLDGGPRAMALTFASRPARKLVRSFSSFCRSEEKDDRIVFEKATANAEDRIAFFEALFASIA